MWREQEERQFSQWVKDKKQQRGKAGEGEREKPREVNAQKNCRWANYPEMRDGLQIIGRKHLEDESQKEEERNEWEDERDNSERKDEEKEKSRSGVMGVDG